MKGDPWQPRDARLFPAFDLWRSGDVDSSLVLFAEAVNHAPLDPDAWRGLGSVLWTRSDFVASLRAFQHALSLEPWSPVHWTTVGLALRDLSRLDQARNALRVATRLDPGYAPAWNELANVLVDLGDPQTAAPLYDLVLSLDASRAVYHHNRGVAHRLLGEFASARANFQEALDLDPDYRWSIAELKRLR
jgi:tetratricopeptide (TPR) repeat protein